MRHIRNAITNWKEGYLSRKKYCTQSRLPFYDISANYLPRDKSSIIVDIGSGDGSFVTHLGLPSKYEHIYYLDANEKNLRNIDNKFGIAILYKAPDVLPFPDATISYIHCSHLVEHLNSRDFYKFLKEIDRVLQKRGIFVISTPIMWPRFFNDLSHNRPYRHRILLKYLCGEQDASQTADIISDEYSMLKLVWRYNSEPLRYGGDNLVTDFILYFLMKFLDKLGVKQYKRNGYTCVLEKGYS